MSEPHPSALTRYDRCAQDAAATVIAAYSTSFSLAARLLGTRVRPYVRDVYALVRIADEIVDGAPAGAGLTPATQRLLLDELEAETLTAIARGFSANLVVHAFALAARACGIGPDLVRPFFASMRIDLTETTHDAGSHDRYVYGSAEVVGLMCLQVFVNAGRSHAVAPEPHLVDGARRLGAAFQDVNFLRDLAHDRDRLGRDYLGIGEGGVTRADILARIDRDLDAAARAIPALPGDCRRAVATAHGLFAELAHRLRTGVQADRVSVPASVKATIAVRALAGARPPEDGRVSRTAAIVGGGISGLATAALLARDGWEVSLFEARGELGGRAGSWERDGFRFDTGPSWYLMPEVFEHFFRLLGTSASAELDLVPLTPAYRVYPEPDGAEPSAPVDVVSGRAAARALFETRELGAGERLDDYLDSAQDAYDLAVRRFLYDPYTSTRGLRDPALLRRMPRLLPLLARTLDRHVAARFRDPVLRQILGYPAVFLGASPSSAPSLYHLMSHLDLAEGVLYPRGGFTAVIDAVARLAREAGATIRTSSPVDRIRVEGGRATGVRLKDGTVHAADVVVSTADLHHTETRLLHPDHRSYSDRWWRRRNPGPGALLLLLGVDGPLPAFAHHTLLFAGDWDRNFGDIFGSTPRIPDPASVYVCRPSATDPTVAPSGGENLFVLVPVPADPGFGHGGVDGSGDATIERAADRVIAQLASWTGTPDLASRVRVRRTIAPADFAHDLGAWRGGALGLAHTLGQSAVFRPRNASRRVDGLLYAGTSVLPGIGLPMCLISAELVLKRVRGDRSSAPLPETALVDG